MAANYATKYSRHVVERWTYHSQFSLASTNNFEFRGDKTVVVYSHPVAVITDYTRSGSNRYGTPTDLTRNIQSMTVERDRGTSFVIDRGDYIQSEFVTNPGTALAREIKEQLVPEFDRYCFAKTAQAAIDNGNYNSTALTASNAYEYFLKAMEFMGDRNVPLDGRVCFCTFAFANLLKRDSAFMKYSDLSQEMLVKGVIGEVDGCKIVRVPSAQLPAGAAFLMVHKDSVTAPRQLEEFKIHDDPPGISGNLIECRFIYDCFVFNEKIDGVYYHGGQNNLKMLNFLTAGTAAGKSTVLMLGEKSKSTNKWYYKTAADVASLPAVSYGATIDVTTSTSDWYGAVELTAASTEITPTSGHKYIIIVEVTSASKAMGTMTKMLNIG